MELGLEYTVTSWTGSKHGDRERFKKFFFFGGEIRIRGGAEKFSTGEILHQSAPLHHTDNRLQCYKVSMSNSFATIRACKSTRGTQARTTMDNAPTLEVPQRA
ncbi:hypothetical protein CDAR_230731 [Caerostris darwini]|uniref:Uncharacterized protein n=1 Tax=Caerostris darwini TaxID=1538125 RepID=A0AAV4S403_9ARAC|nr:hypothetical protein CDAR_230731 [Caerostris darwini]